MVVLYDSRITVNFNISDAWHVSGVFTLIA